MHYTSVFHRFTIDVQDTVEAVRFGQTLKYICGFDMDKESLSEGMHHAPHPPDMRAGLENLFVYCDLIEPVMVGNTRAPLLRTVGITRQVPFGEIIDLNFTNPRYLPLAQNCFNELKISINTDNNLPVPFQGGKVRAAVLHFCETKMSFVPYIPPRNEEEDYRKYFQAQASQSGFGFQGERFQRGTGIGSVLGGMIRSVAPIAKVALKNAGRAAVKAGVQTVHDAVKGPEGVMVQPKPRRQRKPPQKGRGKQTGKGVGARGAPRTLKSIKGRKKRGEPDRLGK